MGTPLNNDELERLRQEPIGLWHSNDKYNVLVEIDRLNTEIAALTARAEAAERERDAAIENMADNFASWEEEWKQEKARVQRAKDAADRWLAAIAEVKSRGSDGLQNRYAEIGGLCAKEILEAIA